MAADHYDETMARTTVGKLSLQKHLSGMVRIAHVLRHSRRRSCRADTNSAIPRRQALGGQLRATGFHTFHSSHLPPYRNHGPLSSAPPCQLGVTASGEGGTLASQDNVAHLYTLLCTWVRSLPTLLLSVWPVFTPFILATLAQPWSSLLTFPINLVLLPVERGGTLPARTMPLI